MSSSYDPTVYAPPRLLLEWLDGNQHRAYPLDESTAGENARIPYPLFVDAFFSITSNIDRASLHISRLVVGDVSLRVFLNGSVSGVDTELGVFADISLDPTATPRGTEIPILVDGGEYTVAGTLVIGDIGSARELPASLDIELESGKIFPGCVRAYDTLTGISVNGQIYTGIVTLEAGNGVELSYDETSNTIKIASTNYEIPEANSYVVSDRTLVDEAVSIFGPPVRMINGVVPDLAGNISIVDPPTNSSESSGDADQGPAIVNVEQVGYGAISITLTNDSTVTTCNDDVVVTVDGLMSSIANLNDRISSIDEAVSALDKANSNLAIQLSRY